VLAKSSPKGSSSMVKLLLLLERRSVKLKDMFKRRGKNEEDWCCSWVWKWREKREEVMHFIYVWHGMHTTPHHPCLWKLLPLTGSERLTFDRGKKKSTSKMGQGLWVWLDSATYHNYYTTLPKWRLKRASETCGYICYTVVHWMPHDRSYRSDDSHFYVFFQFNFWIGVR